MWEDDVLPWLAANPQGPALGLFRFQRGSDDIILGGLIGIGHIDTTAMHKEFRRSFRRPVVAERGVPVG
jgi:hypothetical protein